jgi:hypothetical protein
MYNIKPYTIEQARHLNVIVEPSYLKNKKIDIYNNENGDYITSVGDINYSDFPTYIATDGYEYALQRRRLYKIRHNKYRHNVGSNSWYADQLLW